MKAGLKVTLTSVAAAEARTEAALPSALLAELLSDSAKVPNGLGLNGLAPGGFSGSSSKAHQNDWKS